MHQQLIQQLLENNTLEQLILSRENVSFDLERFQKTSSAPKYQMLLDHLDAAILVKTES